MRISDWSSDVCSSDLTECRQAADAAPVDEAERRIAAAPAAAPHARSRTEEWSIRQALGAQTVVEEITCDAARSYLGALQSELPKRLCNKTRRLQCLKDALRGEQTGSASCRERVCTNVEI